MLTKDIEEKINQSMNFDEEMIENNAPPELHVLLNQYISDKKMTKANVIRMLNIDRNYGYLLLNGSRTPTRKCLIQLSIMLGLDTDRINYLLKLAGKAPLYVRNVVDARVFYAVKHHMEYFEAIDFIWDGSL